MRHFLTIFRYNYDYIPGSNPINISLLEFYTFSQVSISTSQLLERLYGGKVVK